MSNGVTAHRGNSTEYPENTRVAFESALGLGVDWIELDIHQTRDQQLVVIHDADTGRVGDRKALISQTHYEELKEIDVASRFRRGKGLSLPQCPKARKMEHI